MTNANGMERAITAFTEDRNAARFREMELALIDGELLVPVAEEGVHSRGSVHSIPVRCFTTAEGLAAAPAFTTVERLSEWETSGSKYVTLKGHKLIEMVEGMPEIDVIAVNPAGGPRGLIPREDFLRLIALHQSPR